MDGRHRRPTRCPDRQTSGQYVMQLPDDLDYPTLQGSYCASLSLRAAAAPEPYVSFTPRSRLLCYHIIPIKARYKLGLSCLRQIISNIFGFFFLYLFLMYLLQSHLRVQKIALFFGKWWTQGLDVQIRSSIHPFLVSSQGIRGFSGGSATCNGNCVRSWTC